MTSKLEFLLLGPPVVRWHGELISIQRKLSRALLFYLAWQGKLVCREEILDLFWGKDISTNRARLTENLSRLRKALPIDDLIISHDGLVGLDCDKIYVDRLHFEDLVDQAGRTPWQIPESAPLPSDVHQLLCQANALWRGLHPLQGIAFSTSALDDWLRQNSLHIQSLRFKILLRLSDHAHAVRDLPTALDFANCALQYDDLNEEVQFKVLRNLVNMGQRTEARQYFEATQETMLEELGVNPSPRMIHLYQQIRNLERSSSPRIAPNWEIHPCIDVPFVGRKKALREIRKAVDEKQGIVILGESGQGKTRLMQEFIAQIYSQLRVLIAICRPMESTLPFHPIVELLRRHVTPDEWLSLSPVWANHLTGLLPELVQMRDDLDPITMLEDSDQAQAMIFESLRQVFILMNENHPVFLVIDDAQWADEATLSTIAYLLVREPFIHQASLAVMARQEETTNYLQTTLDHIEQTKHALVYQLGSLHFDDITHLAHHLLSDPPSDQLVKRLLADSGGNVFFVLEILRAMGETNAKAVSLDASLPLTENLQNLIISRIQKISSKSREVLEIAAVIGSEFSVQVLGRASLKTPEDLILMLEELESKLLIVPHEQRQGEIFYHFTHDKIRETLLNRLQPARSQLLHTRVVQALNKTPQQAAVLAHHYSGAGELKTAFRYWIKAAEQARALFAKEDASRNYALAESVLQQIVTSLADEEIYLFYADWNDLAYNATETNLLRHIGKELIRLGEERDNHLLIGSGLDSLSDACMTINDFEQGLAYANQAISHLEQTDNCFELVEAYNHRGTFLYMLNRLEEALLCFQDALALSIDEDDPKIHKAHSNAHYQIALLQTLFGKPNRGQEHAVKAFEIAQISKHTYSIVQAYSIRALTQFYMGDFLQARENALLGIDLAQQIQGWRMLGYLNSYAAMAELALGHLDSARKFAEEAIRLGEKYQHFDIVALGCRQLGELHRLLFDYPRAVQYYQKGFDGFKEQFLGLDNLYRLGLTQYYLDQSPTGLDQVSLAQNALEKNAVGIGVMSTKICQALIYASMGEWQEANQLAVELENETLNGGLASFHIIAIILLGEVAFVQGDYDSAYDHFCFAVGESQFIKSPWLEIKVQTALEPLLLALQKDTSKPDQCTQLLLDQLEGQISHPDTREAFRSFRQQICSRTQTATIPI